MLAVTLDWVVQLCDVSCAFPHAPVEPGGKRIIIRPPKGVSDPKIVWQLLKALYGMRESPRLWSEFWAKVMQELGFERSLTDPDVYRRADAYILAHVDDVLMVVAPASRAKLMEEILAKVRMKWLDEVTADKWSIHLGRQCRLCPQGSPSRS